jgi:hypothetical protein
MQQGEGDFLSPALRHSKENAYNGKSGSQVAIFMSRGSSQEAIGQSEVFKPYILLSVGFGRMPNFVH